jgi:hypothetical protein
MWGMGLVCSLFLITFATSDVLEGNIGFRFGRIIEGKIRRNDSPIIFWLIVGFVLAAGAAGAIYSLNGLQKVESAEDKE